MIGPLRVMVYEDDGVWLAQSLEIDYLAQGDTLAECEEHFVKGLSLSVIANVERGTLAGFLQPAPAHIWRQFYAIELYTIKDMVGIYGLPFDSLRLVGVLSHDG